ncbi:MAG: hypothetical protein IKL28_08025 [Lachnospiraceae bacterium]|nr:hypothetical protein [Lachnospiraceae bacterium]
MKKKILRTGMVCVMCMMLGACGKADKSVEPTAAPTATTAPTATEAPTSTPTPEPTATPTPEPTATPTPEPTEAPAVTDSYVKGIITENGFESKWMGLRFTKPATVIMATQEEMDAVMLQGSQVLYGENADAMFDYASLTTVNEMQATWLAGTPIVQIIVEKMPMAGFTEVDYLSAVITNLNATVATSGINYTFGEELYTVKLAGIEFTGLTVAMDAGVGTIVYQDYLVKEKDGRMILIAFSYVEAMESYLQEAVNAFSAY